MSKIYIKKTITLEFLGEDYKDAYLVFQAIPIGDFEQLLNDVGKVQEDKPEKAPGIILGILKNYFREGKFPGEGGLADLDKDDLDGLDVGTVTKVFAFLTGQEIDPKVETP